jgi:mycothiol synthase
MTNVSLSVVDATDAAAAATLRRIAEEASAVDGHRPFNEQALLDIASGRRTAVLIGADEPDTEAVNTGAMVVGAAIVGNGELDLVVAPRFRGRGHATRALPGLLAGQHGTLTAWSHGDHPAARVLAVQFRFVAARTLLQLRLSPIPAVDRAPETTVTIGPFRPGLDDADWVALNALVFAHHPEQGRLTIDDLAARQAEPWFDARDFLIARDDTGRMVGYNWLKVEPDGVESDSVEPDGVEPGARRDSGEIYVVGIHPDAAGRGLGRTLMNAGFLRLHERGIRAAELYVDADNRAAVHLYRALGFTDVTVDVQYRRLTD